MQHYSEYAPGSAQNPEDYGIYPASVHKAEAGYVCMARGEAEDFLLASASLGFVGEAFQNAAGEACVKAALSHENAQLLRRLFPFAAPQRGLGGQRSFGVGDRLGIATPGHIRAIRRFDAFPIFAQQSIRELNLTGRTYEAVLDDASFAVLREGYQGGFGADGDHLKTSEEIRYAISCGYTMITLDCSEHIRNDITGMTDEEVHAAYNSAYNETASKKDEFVGRSFPLKNGLELVFDEGQYMRAALVYDKAIAFAANIFHEYIDGKEIDFEISIDETATPTTPLQHFYVATGLLNRGVRFATMAPRFCGEFQKGIDYIGDIAQFQAELRQHAAIAEHFGYKLSVHSGSDKFTVFPFVGEYTKGRFHVKTAGTNWLEAMRLVAMKDASLYREIHAFALTAFSEARKYYHVTTDIHAIPDVRTLRDEELPALFADDNARQLIHITYGLILNEKDESGAYRFKTRLYGLWREYGEEYAKLLDAHIGKHLSLLYSKLPS